MWVGTTVALCTTLLFPIVYFIYNGIISLLTIWKRDAAVRKFPLERNHWLFGTIPFWSDDDEVLRDYFCRLAEKGRRCHAFWMLKFPYLSVYHPDTAKGVLQRSDPKPTYLDAYAFLRDWLGDGLLLSGGKKWKRNRRLLTPAFHFNILKPYMKDYNRASSDLVAKMAVAARNNEGFDLTNNIDMCTLDVMLSCALSYESNCQKQGKTDPYVEAVAELSDLIVDRTYDIFVWNDFIYGLTPKGRQCNRHCKFVHDFAEKVIANRKAALAASNEPFDPTSMKKLDFLDILLKVKDEDGTGLTDREIRDEVDTFLFEGHDTTAGGLTWTLYNIAKHPEYQRKAQEEVDAIMRDKTKKTIEWEDLPDLKYVTMCIREGLRMNPPVPVIHRTLVQDLVVDGKTVPTGTPIRINLLALHHNPEFWEEPFEYRPDRFLPENMANRNAFAYCPFSAGPRNCIGQNFALHEQRVVIAHILYRFNIELHPDHKPQVKLGPVIKSEKMVLRLTEREHES